MIAKLLISLSLFSCALALDCASETRDYIDSNNVRIEYGKLEVVFETPQMIKLSTDTAKSSFNVTLTEDKITSIISLGPDYTVGTLVTGEFDKNGEFKHSLVGPTYTSILTCSK